MTYWRTYALAADGGGQSTHLEGIGCDYTLCGLDTAGDDVVHRKPPEVVPGKPRITCRHCQQIIDLVVEHMKG